VIGAEFLKRENFGPGKPNKPVVGFIAGAPPPRAAAWAMPAP
jgi:succinyl-CoA synthetase alpha subunit